MSDVPLYERLADKLRVAIRRGDFAPGERLPSERELADQHDVSRTTVTLALKALKAEGLVSSGHGRGTTIRERPLVQVLASVQDASSRREARRLATFNAEIEATGRRPRQEVHEVATLVPPAEIAERLDLDAGERALVRRRRRYVDDEPVALADSYFPQTLVAGSAIETELDHIDRGVLQVLAELGHPVARFSDEVTVRMPSPDERRILRLDAGVPVLRVVRVAVGTDQRPVEVLDQLLAGDKHALYYDVPG